MIALRHVSLHRHLPPRRDGKLPGETAGSQAGASRIGGPTGYGGGPRQALLSDISFEVGAGGFCWLLGASGAGKTSLLRILAMEVPPTTGSVALLGADLRRLPRRQAPRLRRRIGVVHQGLRLLSELSVFDNVALPLRLARRPEPQLREQTGEILDWLGLGGRLRALPRELSGGEQQRAAIARAVVGRPALLLADEPTGNLDDALAARVLQLFVTLHRNGSTVMVATHNAALVSAFAAPRIVLAEGRISTAESGRHHG